MESLIAQGLEESLWDAAKGLWRKGAFSGSPAIFLGLLLYRRICDLWDRGRRCIPVDGELPAGRGPREPRYSIPDTCSWSEVRRHTHDTGAALAEALRGVEEANPSLTGLFSGLGFGDEDKLPDSILQPLVKQIDTMYPAGSQVDEDTFGGVCEGLLKRFADSARASSYTSRGVARLLVELLQPREGMSIYDGASGSGGLLLECLHHLKRSAKNHKSLRLYGQEIDPDAWAVCRMNLLAHGVDDASIERGDTLRNPRHVTGDGLSLRTFDRVISNPPFNLKEWGYDDWLQGDLHGRSAYGVPPRGCGDLAFLQHSLASMNARGMLGMVAPQGILFRERGEGEIRRRILHEDLVEAVIGIAPNILHSSQAPACLLILSNAKPKERRERILFINAVEEYVPGDPRNGLSAENISRISTAFHVYENEDRFCRVVSLKEVERNECNLGIQRYVQDPGEGPNVDLAAEWQTLLRLISERDLAERKMSEHLNRLADPPDER